LIAPAIAAGTSSRIFPPLTVAICFTEDAALAIHPELAIARALKIKAARVSAGADEYESAEGEALKHNPESFAVREQIMYALRLRWGGSREAMQKFADDSQEYADRNPSMRFLLASLPLDRGDEVMEPSEDAALA
jgi:hypothetical protein